MLFSSVSASPSSASRQKSVARLCREETRTRERKSDDETKKETRDDEDDDDDDDDGRGFAFLMKKNFYGKSVLDDCGQSVRRQLFVKQSAEESKKRNGSKKTTKKRTRKTTIATTHRTHHHLVDARRLDKNSIVSNTATTSEDPDGGGGKGEGPEISLSKAFNEWLHDQPIARIREKLDWADLGREL